MSQVACVLRALIALSLLGGAVGAQAQSDDAAAKTFRVCRDPNNLPLSNAKSEGYEDKIAQVLADDLGSKLVFFDFASRFNFIRNTLKFKLPGEDFHCDIVIGVPAGFDQVSATKPYYRSTYAMVVPQGRKLDGVTSIEKFLALPAATLNSLKIGILNPSPASAWLVNHGLLDQGVPYKLLVADIEQTSGGIIENDLVSGKIDVAIVWGPFAGYFAKKNSSTKMIVLPMKSEHGVKFDYDIAMGVRYGEKEWKQQIETLIDRNRAKILAILADYRVPLVEDTAKPAAP